MRKTMITGFAVASVFAMAGVAGAGCFEGHHERMASETPKPSESVTLSTHHGQIKLPAESATEGKAPVETAQ